jgi:hypothetical protein
MNNFMMRVLETLQALLIASILGVILLAGSTVFADDSDDESHTYWHENNRSKSDSLKSRSPSMM